MRINNQHQQQSVIGPMAAIIIFAALSPLVMLTAPAVASQLGQQLHLAPEQIGFLFSAELGAMSLATLPAYWWQGRISWKTTGYIAGVGFILANIASGLLVGQGYYTLLAIRFTTAFFGGTLMILCLSSARLMPNPDRAYGLWLAGQLALSTLALLIFPMLFARFGVVICYYSLAAMTLLVLPLARCFPEPPRSQSNAPMAASRPVEQTPKLPMVLSIIAVLMFYMCIGGVWTFVGEIAAKVSHLPEQLTGSLLAAATTLGVIGAVVASIIGQRGNRGVILTWGYLLLIVAVFLLYGVPDAWRFGAAILLFKTAWTFVLPFILACIASIDRSGQLINTTNLVIGGGFAIGPAIAGQMIGASQSFQPTLTFSISLTAVSLLLLLWSQQKSALRRSTQFSTRKPASSPQAG